MIEDLNFSYSTVRTIGVPFNLLSDVLLDVLLNVL